MEAAFIEEEGAVVEQLMYCYPTAFHTIAGSEERRDGRGLSAVHVVAATRVEVPCHTCSCFGFLHAPRDPPGRVLIRTSPFRPALPLLHHSAGGGVAIWHSRSCPSLSRHAVVVQSDSSWLCDRAIACRHHRQHIGYLVRSTLRICSGPCHRYWGALDPQHSRRV